MRILLQTGDYQYDVANGFVRDLTAALKTLPGHDIQCAELKSCDDLKSAFAAFRPDLHLSLQGICCDKAVAQEFPDTAWIMMGIDHPSYMYFNRYVHMKASRVLITAYEPSHLPCLKQLLPKIPHALLAHPAPSLAPPAREPDQGPCFLGSWENPEALVDSWTDIDIPRPVIDRILLALKQALAQRCADVCQLLPFSEFIWKGNRKHWSYALSRVDQMIRLHVRRRLLQELDNHGIGIDIYGNGWNATEWKHHRIHTAVTYQEALEISARSAAVLSITPCHSGGSHERVLSCLAQGSVCITSPSRFYEDAGFIPGHDYLTYDPWENGSLTQTMSRISAFRSSVDRGTAILAAQQRITQNHSALARAQQILQLAHQHFGLS